MLLGKKKLKADELKEVSGGYIPDRNATKCPKCGTWCQSDINIVEEGDGCDTKAYWLCPKCGYKWE